MLFSKISPFFEENWKNEEQDTCTICSTCATVISTISLKSKYWHTPLRMSTINGMRMHGLIEILSSEIMVSTAPQCMFPHFAAIFSRSTGTVFHKYLELIAHLLLYLHGMCIWPSAVYNWTHSGLNCVMIFIMYPLQSTRIIYFRHLRTYRCLSVMSCGTS